MKYFIIVSLSLSMLISTAFTPVKRNGNGELMQRITERLVFTPSEKQELGEGIAVVSFSVNDQGCVEVISVDASTEEQQKAVYEKLDGYFISNAPVSPGALYSFKIRFGKEQ